MGQILSLLVIVQVTLGKLPNLFAKRREMAHRPEFSPCLHQSGFFKGMDL